DRDSSEKKRTHECNGKDEACSVHAILLPVSTPGRGGWLRVMTNQSHRAPGSTELQLGDRVRAKRKPAQTGAKCDRLQFRRDDCVHTDGRVQEQGSNALHESMVLRLQDLDDE